MRTLQLTFQATPSREALDLLHTIEPQLLLVFAPETLLDTQGLLHSLLRETFPQADLIGCTSGGEVHDFSVDQGHLVITAIHFEHPGWTIATTDLADMQDSEAAGQRLGHLLATDKPHHVLLLAPGHAINGSALLAGLNQALPGVQISGGLAVGETITEATITFSTHGYGYRHIVALGFTTPEISIRTGACGGWRPFGPIRQITRCSGNILYELDGKPALDIYRRYLGEFANNLPASALLFPFELLDDQQKEVGLIRATIGINDQDGSITLAGNLIHQGYLRLMHATTSTLLAGARHATMLAAEDFPQQQVSSLALVVSCIGRILIMGSRIEEEIEAIAGLLGEQTPLTGFYSHGEFAPMDNTSGTSYLHNHTIAVTLLCEQTS